ncbi:MAG: ATP-binding cassette domain-containing protein [Sulfolobales archaeon]|nr:ATP-binding cassette domain-containing protein [Sulfolobales archaeon]
MTVLIEGKDIKKTYYVGHLFNKKSIKALKGVSIKVKEGKTHCIVGESGSGKSTLARIAALIEQPDDGFLNVLGVDALKYHKGDLDSNTARYIRKNIQMVFQDPYSSLNPRSRIKDILEKPFKVYGINFDENKIKELLISVGLEPPEDYLSKYPHQLSGGQRQRVTIARALSLLPKVIILDEPTAALDMTNKAQILQLLIDLKKMYSLTYVIISHEVPIITKVCDDITVLYHGKVVEVCSNNTFKTPVHPYSIGLLSSTLIPHPNSKSNEVFAIPGEPPSQTASLSGCVFASRCPLAEEICKKLEPDLISVSEGHMVACHMFDQKMIEDHMSYKESLIKKWKEMF